MKMRVYLRVAKGARGPMVAASTKPNYRPLETGSGWNARPVPTAAFALDLNVSDEALRQAEQVIAELSVEETDIAIAAEVV